MYLNLGNTTLRELEEFHYFREKFQYLYFCPRCCRNFETFAAVKSCKTCNGAVKLLVHKEKKQPTRKYSYFCEKCGKIQSEKRIAECPVCKSSVLPLYKWDELNLGDRMLVWLSRMTVPSPKKSAPNSLHHERKGPLMPKQLGKLRFSFRKMKSPASFKKSDEELPTNSIK